MSQWRQAVVLLAVFIVFPSAVLAQSDTDGPVLDDLTFPSNIDATHGPSTITFELAVTDSPAGTNYLRVLAYSPSGSQNSHCDSSLSTGSAQDGVWVCNMPIPQYSEEGSWLVGPITAGDAAGNYHPYSHSDLIQLGFQSEFVVASEEDTDGPDLNDLTFPSNIDATHGPSTITFELAVTDSPAGTNYLRVLAYSPSGSQNSHCDSSLSTGSAQDGVWVCNMPIPQYSEEGSWLVGPITAGDAAGNYHPYSHSDLIQLGFQSEFVVASEPDIEPPDLDDLTFPANVDVSAGWSTIRFELAVTDSPAGTNYLRVLAYSPSGSQNSHCDSSLSTGTAQDGIWLCDMPIPQYSEEGSWLVGPIQAKDTANNYHAYSHSELVQRGLPGGLYLGFVEGAPTTTISSPDNGKRVRGNSVTIQGRLLQGNPAEVSPTLGVRFDHRALPFGDFAPIPARNPNHPNPDTSYPYFIHWNLSEVPDGDYELRAVAHDLAGTPDPAPETVTITIDHAGPADVEEYVNAEGRQENQTVVDSAAENKIASGDHTVASTATELTLPPASLLYTTDTAKLVYPDPADEEGQLEQVEQSIGAFVDLSLLSGQSDLEAGLLGDLNISYADANQDGVVDGTSIREEDLELRYLDTGMNSYLAVPSIVLTEHNMVHAEPGFLGKFALAGPLMPRMWIETDKQTLTWDAVSTATSYVVYRGLLSTLTDVDLDGLPDSGFGDCMNHLDVDPTDLLFFDPDDPGAGNGYFYLVGFVGPSGPVGLGNTSAGLPRVPSESCP